MPDPTTGARRRATAARLRRLGLGWASVLVLLCVLTSGWAASEPVKRSASGICHVPGSAYYDRTRHFTAYATLEQCLAAGGRSVAGAPAATTTAPPKPAAAAQTSTGYSRAQFGAGWADADGDCQNSRQEALIAQSTVAVSFTSSRACTVKSGRWISPYTGQVIVNAHDLDIDHIVPLKWAWDHGASGWTSERREQFANDPVNIVAVEASLNRQKGALGPDAWLPPSERCGYVSRFLRIQKRYGLALSAAEQSSYSAVYASICGKK